MTHNIKSKRCLLVERLGQRQRLLVRPLGERRTRHHSKTTFRSEEKKGDRIDKIINILYSIAETLERREYGFV